MGRGVGVFLSVLEFPRVHGELLYIVCDFHLFIYLFCYISFEQFFKQQIVGQRTRVLKPGRACSNPGPPTLFF